MKTLAIRGATTVSLNSKDEILDETAKLIQTILIENLLDKEDIISMCFTMTTDLDAVYPSVAVRDILNILDTPMLNFEEKYIKGSLRHCIRVIMYVNSDKSKKDIKHIYLNAATNLRQDLTNKIR